MMRDLNGWLMALSFLLGLLLTLALMIRRVTREVPIPRPVRAGDLTAGPGVPTLAADQLPPSEPTPRPAAIETTAIEASIESADVEPAAASYVTEPEVQAVIRDEHVPADLIITQSHAEADASMVIVDHGGAEVDTGLRIIAAGEDDGPARS